MPAFSTIAVPVLLRDATRLLTGSRDNKEIAEALLPYGYTPAVLTDALARLDEFRKAISTQGTEKAEARIATRASVVASAAVAAAYAPHRILARRAHPRGTPGYSALDLAGDIPDGELAMLDHARHFYVTLDATPDLADGIRLLSDPAVVALALARLDTAGLAEDDQVEEAGEAQRATNLRARLEATVRAVCSELAETATLALADKPQLREVLGLLER